MWSKNSFDDVVTAYEQDPFSGTHLPPIFIASSSAKDPDWINRYPDKSTVCIISWSNTSMFNNNNKSRKRNDIVYEENKKKVAKMMWDALFKHFPKCRNNVDFSSTGTSETIL